MSIIYDALQKTQRNREYLRTHDNILPKKAPPNHLKTMMMVALVLVISAGSGAIVTFFMRPSSSASQLKLNVVSKQAPVLPGKPQTILVDASKQAPKASQPSVSVPVAAPMPQVSAPVVLAANAPTPPQPQVAAPAPVVLAANTSAPPPVAVPQAPAAQESLSEKLKCTLNGVLISGTEKVALIDNQPYHLGDVISGMKIVSIELNSVKLQNGQNLIELRV